MLLQEVDPETLLERVAQGDREAVMALYDRFSGVLLAVALRVLGQRAEAEDVVQDVFARVWREAGGFNRQRGSAAAWLITLARNRSIDVVRARRRRTEHEADEPEAPAVDAQETPELALSDAQRAAAVRLAMAELRPEQRAVLELAYFSGLSHSEIAARLDQPLGTVKTRIAQSVRKLREALARFAPQGGDRDHDGKPTSGVA